MLDSAKNSIYHDIEIDKDSPYRNPRILKIEVQIIRFFHQPRFSILDHLRRFARFPEKNEIRAQVLLVFWN